MHRTLVIRREYLHFVPKYSRYEKRHKNLAAHVSPAFRVEEGDQVTVGQCRPLSKTVRTGNMLGCQNGEGSLYTGTDARALGSIQCSPSVTTYWKGCKRVSKILDVDARDGDCIVVYMICYEVSCSSSILRKQQLK